MSKHLTDTECAAEYWRATAIHWRFGLDPLEAPATREASWVFAAVWHRFATHPHAHEEGK